MLSLVIMYSKCVADASPNRKHFASTMQMDQSTEKRKGLISKFWYISESCQFLWSIQARCYLWLCRWRCVRVLRRLLTLLWSLGNSRDGGACSPAGPILCPCSLITQSRFKTLKTTQWQTSAQVVQDSNKMKWKWQDIHCIKYCKFSKNNWEKANSNRMTKSHQLGFRMQTIPRWRRWPAASPAHWRPRNPRDVWHRVCRPCELWSKSSILNVCVSLCVAIFPEALRNDSPI